MRACSREGVYVRACVRACMRVSACVRAGVYACVRVCMRACTRGCRFMLLCRQTYQYICVTVSLLAA